MKLTGIELQESDFELIKEQIINRLEYPFLKLDDNEFDFDIKRLSSMPEFKNDLGMFLEVDCKFAGRYYNEDGFYYGNKSDFNFDLWLNNQNESIHITYDEKLFINLQSDIERRLKDMIV